MRVLCGAPRTISPVLLERGESVVAVACSPRGNLFCVLTQLQIQFWTGLQHALCVAAIPLDRCSLLPGRDVGCELAWQPSGRAVVVSTIARRLLFFETDILVTDNTRAVTYRPDQWDFEIADGMGRVAVGPQVQLDHGLIVALRPADGCLLVSTSGGFLAIVGWAGALRSAVAVSALVSRLDMEASSASEDALADSAKAAPVAFDYAPQRQWLALALSSGRLIIGRLSLEVEGVAMQPVASATHPVADRIALNATFGLLATGSGCVVRLYSIDGGHLCRVEGCGSAWCDEPRGLRTIHSMQWSADGTMLCVSFGAKGLALFHRSGACVATTFSRLHGSVSPIPFPSGCRAAAWGCFDTSLVAIDDARCRIAIFDTAKPVTGGPALVLPAGLRCMRSDGQYEAVAAPPHYLRRQYPLRFGATSPGGEQHAVAGPHGIALYSARLQRWRTADVTVEQSFSCCCPPAWLGEAVVIVGARLEVDRRWALLVLANHHACAVGPTGALACLPLDRRPVDVAALQCPSGLAHQAWAAVLTTDGAISLFSLALVADSKRPGTPRCDVLATRHLALGPDAGRPLRIALLSSPEQQRRPGLPPAPVTAWPAMLVLGADRRLWTVRCRGESSTAAPLSLDPKRDTEVFDFWLDGGGERPHIVASGPTGLVLSCLDFPAEDALPVAGNPMSIAEFDAEAVPTALLAGEGLLVHLSSGIDRQLALPGAMPTYLPAARLNLYRPFHLLRLVEAQVAGDGGGRATEEAWDILQRLREGDNFTDTLDYLLFLAIHVDLRVDRRLVLQGTLALLRRFPEFHHVVTRCVRKIDVSKWRSIFDIIGTPQDFLDGCVEKGLIHDAAHVVRVVLMDAPGDPQEALERTLEHAQRLFGLAVRGGELHLAHDLLRFIALLRMEISLPAAQTAEAPATAIEKALRTLWPARTGKDRPAPAKLEKPQPGAGAASSQLPTDALLRQAHDGGDIGMPHHTHTLVALLEGTAAMRCEVETAAAKLLASGRVVELCRLFATFSLDLPHYLGVQWPRTAHAAPTLTAALQSLHAEFGLCTGEVAQSMTAAESFFQQHPIFRNAAGVATVAQAQLAAVPSAHHALRALGRLFEVHACAVFELAVAVVLLSVERVASLCAEHEELAEQLRTTTQQREWRGYAAIVDCI